jgi:hypothetical protein
MIGKMNACLHFCHPGAEGDRIHCIVIPDLIGNLPALCHPERSVVRHEVEGSWEVA